MGEYLDLLKRNPNFRYLWWGRELCRLLDLLVFQVNALSKEQIASPLQRRPERGKIVAGDYP